MSTAIDNISILHYSPFVLAPIFEVFYESLPLQPKNILLAYLVLPLLMKPETKSFFINARASSSLRTFCSERARLYGLQDRIAELKDTTNQCLILASESGAITFHEDMSVSFNKYSFDKTVCPSDTIQAGKKLASILSPYDIPSIYRFLGVKQL